MKKLATGIVSTIVLSNHCLAHPGHAIQESTASHSAAHYLIEPVHALPLLASVALIITAGSIAWRMRNGQAKEV